MKKILFSCIFVALLAFSAISSNAALYKYGDADGNGSISIADVTKIQKCLVRKDTMTDIQKAVSDVDANNKINIMDVTAIQRHLSGYLKQFKSGEYFDDKGDWLPGEFE